MAGKTVVVTGATNGIGKATAFALARAGARIILVGRNASRVEQVVEELRGATESVAIHGEVADLAVMAQVRALAARLLTRESRVDVLINNVGAFFPQRQLTSEGIEATFALNHLSPFLLTNLLVERLRESAPARVITVSSSFHKRSAVDLDDLEATQRYSPLGQYNRTKGMNILFTRELVRRLAARGMTADTITANTLHPGLVDSGFFRRNSGLLAWTMTCVVTPLGRTSGTMITPEQAARTSVYLASSPDVLGVTGKYFVKRHEARPSESACDDTAGYRLWEASARRCDLAEASLYHQATDPSATHKRG